MPDDPEIEEMDPIMKMWMFNNWIEDSNENIELLKHTGYLIGSFIDPKAARELAEKPSISSTDEVFEETFKEIAENNKRQEEIKNMPVKRRKRKKVS